MQQITISPISNGWLVYVPLSPATDDFWSEDKVRNMARAMQDEIKGDPLLRELQGTEKKEPALYFEAESNKDTQAVFFKTFPEVLTYLDAVVIDH